MHIHTIGYKEQIYQNSKAEPLFPSTSVAHKVSFLPRATTVDGSTIRRLLAKQADGGMSHRYASFLSTKVTKRHNEMLRD